MTTCNEGDLVEAVKGETVIRGRVELSPELGEPILVLPGVALSATTHLIRYGERGFILTVIEKAASKLPTEPGVYFAGGLNADVEGVLRLTNGQWWWVGNRHGVVAERLTDADMFAHAPLTRLEPVPVTARKVLDAFLAQLAGSEWTSNSAVIQDVAKEFGIES